MRLVRKARANPTVLEPGPRPMRQEQPRVDVSPGYLACQRSEKGRELPELAIGQAKEELERTTENRVELGCLQLRRFTPSVGRTLRLFAEAPCVNCPGTVKVVAGVWNSPAGLAALTRGVAVLSRLIERAVPVSALGAATSVRTSARTVCRGRRREPSSSDFSSRLRAQTPRYPSPSRHVCR
jgi:hypothetical protein